MYGTEYDCMYVCMYGYGTEYDCMYVVCMYGIEFDCPHVLIQMAHLHQCIWSYQVSILNLRDLANIRVLGQRQV